MDQKGYFSIENVTKHLYLPFFFYKNEKKKKFQIFDQNHGLTLLEKCKFSTFFKSMFLKTRKASFQSKTSPDTLSPPILPKTKRRKNFKVLTKTMAQPLYENANFVTFLNECFYSPQRLVFYLHRAQTPFLALFRQKRKEDKMTNFFPLEKCKFCDFLKSMGS